MSATAGGEAVAQGPEAQPVLPEQQPSALSRSSNSTGSYQEDEGPLHWWMPGASSALRIGVFVAMVVALLLALAALAYVIRRWRRGRASQAPILGPSAVKELFRGPGGGANGLPQYQQARGASAAGGGAAAAGAEGSTAGGWQAAKALDSWPDLQGPHGDQMLELQRPSTQQRRQLAAKAAVTAAGGGAGAGGGVLGHRADSGACDTGPGRDHEEARALMSSPRAGASAAAASAALPSTPPSTAKLLSPSHMLSTEIGMGRDASRGSPTRVRMPVGYAAAAGAGTGAAGGWSPHSLTGGYQLVPRGSPGSTQKMIANVYGGDAGVEARLRAVLAETLGEQEEGAGASGGSSQQPIADGTYAGSVPGGSAAAAGADTGSGPLQGRVLVATASPPGSLPLQQLQQPSTHSSPLTSSRSDRPLLSPWMRAQATSSAAPHSSARHILTGGMDPFPVAAGARTRLEYSLAQAAAEAQQQPQLSAGAGGGAREAAQAGAGTSQAAQQAPAPGPAPAAAGARSSAFAAAGAAGAAALAASTLSAAAAAAAAGAPPPAQGSQGRGHSMAQEPSFRELAIAKPEGPQGHGPSVHAHSQSRSQSSISAVGRVPSSGASGAGGPDAQAGAILVPPALLSTSAAGLPPGQHSRVGSGTLEEGGSNAGPYWGSPTQTQDSSGAPTPTPAQVTVAALAAAAEAAAATLSSDSLAISAAANTVYYGGGQGSPATHSPQHAQHGQFMGWPQQQQPAGSAGISAAAAAGAGQSPALSQAGMFGGGWSNPVFSPSSTASSPPLPQRYNPTAHVPGLHDSHEGPLMGSPAPSTIGAGTSAIGSAAPAVAPAAAYLQASPGMHSPYSPGPYYTSPGTSEGFVAAAASAAAAAAAAEKAQVLGPDIDHTSPVRVLTNLSAFMPPSPNLSDMPGPSQPSTPADSSAPASSAGIASAAPGSAFAVARQGSTPSGAAPGLQAGKQAAGAGMVTPGGEVFYTPGAESGVMMSGAVMATGGGGTESRRGTQGSVSGLSPVPSMGAFTPLMYTPTVDRLMTANPLFGSRPTTSAGGVGEQLTESPVSPAFPPGGMA